MPSWVVTGLVAVLPVVLWAVSVQLRAAFNEILKSLQVSVSSRDDAVISRILNGALERKARLIVQGLVLPNVDQILFKKAAAAAFIRFCEENMSIFFSPDDVYVEFVKVGSGKTKSMTVVQLSPAMAEALLEAAGSLRSGVTIAAVADADDIPASRGRSTHRGRKKSTATVVASPEASPSPTRTPSPAPSKKQRTRVSRPSPPVLATIWVAVVMLAAAAMDGKIPALDRVTDLLGFNDDDGKIPAAPYTMRDWRNMRRVCNMIRAGNFTQTAILEGLVHPVMCKAIIQAAEDFAAQRGGWTTDRHKHYPTTDLDTKYVPALNFPVRNMVHRLIIPKMGTVFGINPLLLGINEVFIAKYAFAEGQQRSLDAHRDGSDFSFVVTLNEEYDGGGTRFVKSDVILKGKTGDVVTFCGQNRHEGLPVSGGTRYILAGFLSFGEPGGCEDLFERDENEEREKERMQEMEEGQSRGGDDDDEDEETEGVEEGEEGAGEHGETVAAAFEQQGENNGAAAAASEEAVDPAEVRDRELLEKLKQEFEVGELQEHERRVADGTAEEEEEDEEPLPDYEEDEEDEDEYLDEE